MKLRNKKTGEIVEPRKIGLAIYSFTERNYNSLAELNEEWEDYKEPMYYFIADTGEIKHEPDKNDDVDKFSKRIGNYFNTWEEANDAMEKLKAWKRLKDKKIFIWLDHFDYRSQEGSFNVEFEDNLSSDELNQVNDDLDLLFGGEE